MTKEMYDHQKRAVEFIVAAENDESETNKAYMLCDEMGLGKTQAVVESFFVSKLVGRSLIITPPKIIDEWKKTIDEVSASKHIKTKVYVILHANSDIVPTEDVCVMMISYAVLLKMYTYLKERPASSLATAKLVYGIKWTRIVFDEIHTIRSSQRKTHEACRALDAGSRGGVSASPVHNSVDDLRSIAEVLRVAYISTLIGMKTLKRTMKEVAQNDPEFEPPELEEHVVKAPFETDDEKQNYIHAIRQFDSSLGETGQTKSRALEVFSRLRISSVASCCIGGLRPNMITPERTFRNTKSTKMNMMINTLNEDPSDDVVVFSEWTSVLEVAYHALLEAGFTIVGKVVGGTKPSMVGTIINELFERKQHRHPRVLLASLRSFYQSVNWQRFNKVVFLEPPLNPQIRNQATGRVRRIGQERRVKQVMLIIAGSVEERVLGILDIKQDIALSIFGDSTRIRHVLVKNLVEMLETQKSDPSIEEEENTTSLRRIIAKLGDTIQIKDIETSGACWMATDVDDWNIPETCVGLPLPVVVTEEGKPRRKYDSPFASRVYKLSFRPSMKNARLIRIASPAELMKRISDRAKELQIDDVRFHCGRMFDVANAFRHHLCGEVIDEVRPAKISVWGFLFDDGAILALWPLRLFEIKK
jgi:SNF2 family DNA or RNA helicase